MSAPRCSYFSMTVVLLTEAGHGRVVRVPRYNCLLMDTMLQRLRFDPEGQQIAFFLQPGDLGKPSDCIYGPDLEIRSPTDCTQKRCRESCTPEFTRWMQECGQDASLPARD